MKGLIKVVLLLAPQLIPALCKADNWNFSFQPLQGWVYGSGGSGIPVSGSGSFAASPQCTAGGTYGAYTITSLNGELSTQNQTFQMGFTSSPCMNFIDSGATYLPGILFHNTIQFSADNQQWEFLVPTVPDPLGPTIPDAYILNLSTGNLYTPVDLTLTPVITPEPSTLLLLGIGLLSLLDLRSRMSSYQAFQKKARSANQ